MRITRKVRQGMLTLAVLLAVGCTVTQIPDLKGDPLNPEQHRARIVAIDAVLFEDGPLDEAGRDRAAQTLLELADVAEADPANTIAKALGRDLRTLSNMTRATKAGKIRVGGPLRANWIRIRGSLFDDAAWFRQSSADPIEPAVAGPPPGSGSRSMSGLRPATLDERAGLDRTVVVAGYFVERGRKDLPDAKGSERWAKFVAEVTRELAIAVERLGPTPHAYGVDNYYRGAHIHAAEALKNLQLLIDLPAGASTSSREFLINKVEEHQRKAQGATGLMMRKND